VAFGGEGACSFAAGERDQDDPPDGGFGHLSKYPLVDRARQPPHEAVRLSRKHSGLIDVITPSQHNWKAPMRIEVSNGPPPLDADAWDQVVEVPLPIPSGTLYFDASGGGADARRV
jgi:hypothetical protein